MIIKDKIVVAFSKEEYTLLKAQHESYTAARAALCGDGYVTLMEQKMLPTATTNDDISILEIYEFLRDVPEKYFVYINEAKKWAVTFVGHKLGDVVFGREYRAPSFGGVTHRNATLRQPVRIHAINGRDYFGTYYKGSGSYARIKLCKVK